MSGKYVIDFTKNLGQGATAQVYFGIKVDDGTQYALKCSRQTLRKEISNMKELDHKNIIKFYDSLNNFKGYTQVIVMELCNKGSLYDFIELHQGLCDNMFLKVLECLHQGLFFLRGRHIVHRDIKPGNMMVHQDNMGYYHVKLGDLGTAKKVDDTQTFETLVGTEEYLHPDMYIRYLEGIYANFRASVDLWSTGVTLYHAAVTQLPFIPYNYSRNSELSKKTLRQMYDSKRPGVISGRQNSAREDDITWSSKLPDNCRLSPMLKDMASKLIGNLMDLSESNSYDRFFEEANRILQKKRMLFFNSLNGELQLLYLDSLTYNNVVDQIAKSTGLPKNETIILTKSKRLEALPDPEAQCLRTLPIKGNLRFTVTDDTALIVTTKLLSEPLPLVIRTLSTNQCDAPSQKYKQFKDAKRYSEDLMKAIYQVSYSANYVDCQVESYLATVYSFNEHVMMENLRLMNEALPWQMKAIRDLCTMTESLVQISEQAINNRDGHMTTHESLLKCKEEIDQLRNKAIEGEKCGEQYYTKIVEKREMLRFTERNFCNDDDLISSDNLDFLVHLAEELVNEVKLVPEDKLSQGENVYKLEIWQRHIRLLKFFEVSKEKFINKSKRVVGMHQTYYIWLKQGLSVMDRIVMLRDFLHRQEERRLNLRTKFLQIYEFIQRILEQIDLTNIVQYAPMLNFSPDDVLKARIMEVKELSEQMKNKFVVDATKKTL